MDQVLGQTGAAAASPRPFSLSLTTLLILAFVSLVGLCAGGIIYLTYTLNTQILLSVANADFEKTALSTIDNTDFLLQPPSAAVDQSAVALEESDIITREDVLLRQLYQIVSLYPQTYAAYVALQATGDFFQVQRIPPGSATWGPNGAPTPPGARYVVRRIVQRDWARVETYDYIAEWGRSLKLETVGTPTYEPRNRPFYRQAWATADRILTDIYVFASNGKPGITIARKFSRAGAEAGVVGVDITLESLSRFLRAQPVGANGVALILDRDGRIVAAPEEALEGATRGGDGSIAASGLKKPEIGAAWQLYRSQADQRFTFPFAGADYLVAFRPFPSSFGKPWILMEIAPIDDFIGRLKSTVRSMVLLSLGIAAVVLLASVLLARGVTRPIARVIKEADRIRTFDFGTTRQEQSRISEIQRLIDSVAAMKTAIQTLASEKTDPQAVAALLASVTDESPQATLLRRVAGIAEARRAQEVEMDLAAEIQQSVLPNHDLEAGRTGARIAARMRAAKDVGGDFYDWIWRDQNRLVFMVGDVSGKGVPAALFMAITRTAIRSMILAGSTVPKAIETTNNLLAQSNDRCFFVTLFVGEIDIRSGVLSYITAGHEAAILLSDVRGRSRLRSVGPALGVIEGATFEMNRALLLPGDTILTMTDGVTDALDGDGNVFGVDRLEAVLDRAGFSKSEPEQIVGAIISAVDAFAGRADQFDDITCLSVHYENSPARQAFAPRPSLIPSTS